MPSIPVAHKPLKLTVAFTARRARTWSQACGFSRQLGLFLRPNELVEASPAHLPGVRFGRRKACYDRVDEEYRVVGLGGPARCVFGRFFFGKMVVGPVDA